MADISLDLTSFNKALARLSEGLVQRFGVAFQDLIRAGNEQGLLLSDWPRWRTYRDMRSKTSHTDRSPVRPELVEGLAARGLQPSSARTAYRAPHRGADHAKSA
ncbi:hypothetical protein [Leptothrix ochracea]|uniref:hypothetical protein n=1 Tax=Leptothrix ochracea TaxID=735331 RepID=UPI0034E28AD2